MKAGGSAMRKFRPVDKDYIHARIKLVNTCWVWQKQLDYQGYGRIKGNPYGIRAHRVSYQLFVGAIPEGLVLRHTCNNKSCVNPEHLILGTHKENAQDREAMRRVGIGFKTYILR